MNFVIKVKIFQIHQWTYIKKYGRIDNVWSYASIHECNRIELNIRWEIENHRGVVRFSGGVRKKRKAKLNQHVWAKIKYEI